MINDLTPEDVIFIHEDLIHAFGGSPGIRDTNALEAAVYRIQTGYYEEVVEQAAAFMESLAINHPFVDGNKLVSFFCTDVFLRNNGLYINCPTDIAYKFYMDSLAKGTFKYENILQWLQKHVKQL
ncbi:MAG: type II toxin-antitoxin system death-on-curing family toxin [Candidatus Brocadiales bacterium]|nr:type II toxin-antitoxin system death-on-curing family toxin [Candidatus Brocadiales bacterium]